jgi:hypothetical protein
MHKQNVRFIANVAEFAGPVFTPEQLVDWKKEMLVEYWQLLLKEGQSPGLRDFGELRSAIGLATEPLGRRRWLRLLEYMRRHFVRAAGRGLRRNKAAPPAAAA